MRQLPYVSCLMYPINLSSAIIHLTHNELRMQSEVQSFPYSSKIYTNPNNLCYYL